jgi:S-formylglutathione hydrolase
MYQILKKHKTFEGETIFCEHDSSATKTTMKFSAFLPTDIDKIDSAIIWLSGLTCTEENFITKAGSQSYLKGTKTMIICPDTSPRGLGLDGEDDSYDFGTGAGFYVNATVPPYDKNYKMEDYIVKDLVSVLKDDFKVNKISISGHSMGGHGALILGLKNPEIFSSISAFSPIVNPSACPWGQKALKGYLGEKSDNWLQNDTCELLKLGKRSKAKILIDQGTDDEFLKDQLLSDNFVNVAKEVGQEHELNYREGYDHSYYFIASFIKNHINHHLNFL